MVNLPKLPLRIAETCGWIFIDSADGCPLDSIRCSVLGGWEIPDAHAAAERRLAELTEMIEAASKRHLHEHPETR